MCHLASTITGRVCQKSARTKKMYLSGDMHARMHACHARSRKGLGKVGVELVVVVVSGFVNHNRLGWVPAVNITGSARLERVE